MSTTDLHAEHSVEEHAHGENCGHDAVQHDDHIDYMHDGHKHAAHVWGDALGARDRL